MFDLVQTFRPEIRFELLQMMNDLRPVAEIFMVSRKAPPVCAAIEELQKRGYFVACRDIGRDTVTYFVSKEQGLAEEAAHMRDPRRFGELMGFPDSAIEAFVAHKPLMTHADLEELIGLPLGELFMYVKFSGANTEDAKEYVRRSLRILLDQAPELLREMLARGVDFEEYKKKASRFAEDTSKKYGCAGNSQIC